MQTVVLCCLGADVMIKWVSGVLMALRKPAAR